MVHVMFGSMDEEAFELRMAAMSLTAPMVSVDPSYARKLLRDLAAWSQSIGFEIATAECAGRINSPQKSRVPDEAAGRLRRAAHVLSSQPRLWQLRKREEAL